MAQNNENVGRGFAGMSEDERREAGRKGGKAAHQGGNANQFDSESGRAAGKTGGQSSGTQSDTERVENM